MSGRLWNTDVVSGSADACPQQHKNIITKHFILSLLLLLLLLLFFFLFFLFFFVCLSFSLSVSFSVFLTLAIIKNNSFLRV